MEKDDEIKGSGNHLSFGDYGYDPRIGRRWSIDPEFKRMQSLSPYSSMFNNPISFMDPNGLYPIYFVTRSYAPFKWFGPFKNNWHGDNRKHSLDRGASYRSLVSIVHDTELHTTTAIGGKTRSHNKDFSKDATSTTQVENRSNGGKIDVHSSGPNKAQKGAQPIDQFTKLEVSLTGNANEDHVLNIKGTISGDDFPNQESFVYDKKGTALWLGNFETSGDQEWGPVFDLFFENEDDVQINVNIRVNVNKKGNFKSVIIKENGKDKTISIKKWNKSKG
jgi:hypothetical protein